MCCVMLLFTSTLCAVYVISKRTMHGEDSQRSNVVKQSKTYIGAGLSVYFTTILHFPYTQKPQHTPYAVSMYSVHTSQRRSAVVISRSVHAFGFAIWAPTRSHKISSNGGGSNESSNNNNNMLPPSSNWHAHSLRMGNTQRKETTECAVLKFCDCMRYWGWWRRNGVDDDSNNNTNTRHHHIQTHGRSAACCTFTRPFIRSVGRSCVNDSSGWQLSFYRNAYARAFVYYASLCIGSLFCLLALFWFE